MLNSLNVKRFERGVVTKEIVQNENVQIKCDTSHCKGHGGAASSAKTGNQYPAASAGVYHVVFFSLEGGEKMEL